MARLHHAALPETTHQEILMARTLAAIIREMKLIEDSTMTDSIKAWGLAKLKKEAEQLAADGVIQQPATDPRQVDIEDAAQDPPKGRKR